MNSRPSPIALPEICSRPRSSTTPPEPEKAAVDAKLMAERSIKADYMKDTLKCLKIAHESDPSISP